MVISCIEEMRNVYIIATTVKKFRINGSRGEKQVFLVNVIRSSLVRGVVNIIVRKIRVAGTRKTR